MRLISAWMGGLWWSVYPRMGAGVFPGSVIISDVSFCGSKRTGCTPKLIETLPHKDVIAIAGCLDQS